MTPLSLRQIRHAVGGKSLNVIPDESIEVAAVCTDSRAIVPGSIFVAIRGDAFDGHAFVAQAAASGAIAAVVETVPPNIPPTLPLIGVAHSRIALGRLAKTVRQGFRSKVIAVGGSNGKTTTKHLIHAALRGRLKGSISPKSYNNDIGVPLTLFLAEPRQDYLVLEIGTNHPGEIKPLSDMSQPDIAIITNCGPEHLQGLGDLVGVRRENAQITTGLNPKGLLIVNGDDPELLEILKNEWSGRQLTFGLSSTCDIFATHIVCTERGTEFSMNGRAQRVRIPMLGQHSAVNALAAVAVARSLRIPEETVIESLAKSDGPEMRLQLQTLGGVTLLNDAYNANPASMQAAIQTLAGLPTQGRRIAVLGDMRELGATSDMYHMEMGQFAVGTGHIDRLICVGEQARKIADAAIGAGLAPSAVACYESSLAAAADVKQWVAPGDLVLLKASRGIKLEHVATAIGANF